MPTFAPPTPAEKEEMKREAAEKAAKEKAGTGYQKRLTLRSPRQSHLTGLHT